MTTMNQELALAHDYNAKLLCDVHEAKTLCGAANETMVAAVRRVVAERDKLQARELEWQNITGMDHPNADACDEEEHGPVTPR